MKAQLTEDPSEVIYPCQLDGCSQARARKFMHSFSITYATPGLELLEDGSYKQYPSFNCDGVQHWACSHDHAHLLALECLQDHFHDSLQEGVHYAPDVKE